MAESVILNDSRLLSSTDQVFASTEFFCAVPAVRLNDFAEILGRKDAISAVLEVEQDRFLNPVKYGFTVRVNPSEGTTAGAVRAAILSAWSELSSFQTFACTEFTIGGIQMDRATPLEPSTKQVISLSAMAILALVAVFFFVKLKG